MTAVLPPEVWCLVIHQLPCQFRLRGVSACFYQQPCLLDIKLTRKQLNYLINRAAWYGKPKMLSWVLDTWQLRLNPTQNEFPLALALERGKLSVVKYLFRSQRMCPGRLNRMCKSLPLAMQKGHYRTVAYVVAKYERYMEKCGITATEMSNIQIDRIKEWLATKGCNWTTAAATNWLRDRKMLYFYTAFTKIELSSYEVFVESVK